MNRDGGKMITSARCRGWLALAWGLCAALGSLSGACGESSLTIDYRNPAESAAQDDAGDGGQGAGTGGSGAGATGGVEGGATEEDVASAPLLVTRVEPATGSSVGGFDATVVGSGFVEGSLVHFGDVVVSADATTRLSSNEIQVEVPPGDVGQVDVLVELPTGEAILYPGGFTYHGLNLSPAEGTVDGGTFVEVWVSGDAPSEAVELWFGDAPCTELTTVVPGQLQCKTPEGVLGSVAVSLRDPQQPALDQVAEAAFTYTDPAAGPYGGLGGEPISGTLQVRVLDSTTQAALPGVWVLLGDDPQDGRSAQTNEQGRVTFAAADLAGPVTVHAALDCYVRSSLHGFDAQYLTLYLTPTGELRCEEELDPEDLEDEEGSEGELPGGGTGSGTAAAVVSGELIFPGPAEFASNAWDVVPKPRADEERVTYVYTSRSGLFSGASIFSSQSALQRITEQNAVPGIRGGYGYAIYSRPAGLAIYALSGLERSDTGEFVPYVMGVTRDVVVAPGESRDDVDIEMNLLLERTQEVQLEKVPAATTNGPFEFWVQLHIDLGAEGVLMRPANGALLDVRSSASPVAPFSFYAQPALDGVLRDARYALVAGWYSGSSYSDLPYTEVVKQGLRQSADALVVDDLLAIPEAEAPHNGQALPADRVLRFRVAGATPDFYWVRLYLSDGTAVWGHIVPGDSTSVSVPDLSTLPGLSDLTTGLVYWTVRAVRAPGFEYDSFNYSHLDSTNWTHDAANDFVLAMP